MSIKINKENEQLKNNILNTCNETEFLRKEMCDATGEKYTPKYDLDSLFNENSTEKWQKADWIAVYAAGVVGITLDILTTQTNILKPVNKTITQFMRSDAVAKFKMNFDNFSGFFRGGNSAPIDFQDFDMFGLKSIHEQYSFGHDPLRFIEGIIQLMTGNYHGIDKLGNSITAQFGVGIPNIFHAVLSYIAHMVSDFCNILSLPYPGSTLLMQFGSQEIRTAIATAYRSQLYNSRTFVYQGLPLFFMSLIIHGWAVYDNYTRTKKIQLLIGNSLKYQPMLLASNAMVMTSNLCISGVRSITEGYHALFRVNYPVIINTVKHSIRFLQNEHRAVKLQGARIERLLQETTKNQLTKYTTKEYLNILDKEFAEFSKKNL